MKVALAWLACAVIWGTTWFFIKIGLTDLPPFSFAGIRFIVAFLTIAPIVLLWRLPLPASRRDWMAVIIPGFLTFGINYALVFWGELHITSGLAAVLQATIPAFGLIFARFYLPDETINIQKVLSILVGLIGVAVIFYEQLQVSGWLALAGSAALVFSAVSAGFANVLVKSFGSKLHPLSLTGGQMLVGLVPLCAAGFLIEGNPLALRWTWQSIVSVLYLAVVGSVVAFGLYYWLLQRMEATKTMVISLVTPIVAVVVGALALGETLPAGTLIGSLLVLFSVFLMLIKTKAKQPEIGVANLESQATN